MGIKYLLWQASGGKTGRKRKKKTLQNLKIPKKKSATRTQLDFKKRITPNNVTKVIPKEEKDIVYESFLKSFKITYPNILEKLDSNLNPPKVLILFKKQMIDNNEDLFQINIDIGIYNFGNKEISKENFDELYPKNIEKTIIDQKGNIIDSQITYLKDLKIHKLKAEIENVINLFISIPIEFNLTVPSSPIIPYKKNQLYLIRCIYNKDKESFYLPIFNKILESFEYIDKAK